MKKFGEELALRSIEFRPGSFGAYQRTIKNHGTEKKIYKGTR